MNWIIDNWYLVVIGLCVLGFIVYKIVTWLKTSNSTKIANIKEWLKYAVVESEKSLGERTGQLKLRMVYDMAVNKFPWIVNLVSFDTFTVWVDDALDWMKQQLDSNKKIDEYVKGSDQ